MYYEDFLNNFTYSPRLRKTQNENKMSENNNLNPNQNMRQYSARQVSIPLQMSNEFKTEFELKEMYPEIYTVAEPMIEAVAMKNKFKPLSRNLIEEMTTEVYDALEVDPINNSQEDTTDNSKAVQVNSRPRPRPRPSNPLLRDLLKILLLNRLLNNRQHNSPYRPAPYPNRPHNSMKPFPYNNNMNYFSTPYPEDFY